MQILLCVIQGWGKTIVLGVDKPGAQLSLSSFDVLHSGKILTGSLFGGLKAKSDIPILVKRYMDKVNLEITVSFFSLFWFSCQANLIMLMLLFYNGIIV